MPRDGWERFQRAVTPLHFYLCRDCEHRGSHWGTIRSAPDAAAALGTSRPIEERDRIAAHAKLRSAVLSVVFATILGAAAGAYVHSCRQDAEIPSPHQE
jgi:hypothetical protein